MKKKETSLQKYDFFYLLKTRLKTKKTRSLFFIEKKYFQLNFAHLKRNIFDKLHSFPKLYQLNFIKNT